MKNFPFIKEIFIAFILIIMPFSLIAEAMSTNIKSNKPKLEVIKFDNDYNIVDSTSTDKYLLVPVDKHKLKKEANQSKLEDLSRSLIKETPKPLTTQLELKSKLHINSTSILYKVLTKISQPKKYKIFAIINLSFILIAILIIVIWVIIKRFKINFKASTLNQTEETDILSAINEFEKTEEKKEKLKRKKYIQNIDEYKPLEGFKKDIPPDFIKKNIENLEKNQKNELPLSLREISNLDFKTQNYIFDEKIGYVSDEEGLALFEDEESTFTSNNEDFEINYYDDSSENFYSNDNEDEVFIIEDEELEIDNTYDEYKIIENINSLKEEKEKVVIEEHQEIEEQKVETTSQKKETTKSNEQPFKIIDKYQLSDTKGLALLSYKSKNILIGYINSNIVILKKFHKSEKITNLSVRIYETIEHDKIQYLVKIGMFKGVVEVSNDSMKLVLNL